MTQEQILLKNIVEKLAALVELEQAGGSGVDSVFGRSGVVTAVANDYTSDLIGNDSTVAGASVTAALETLKAGGVPEVITIDPSQGPNIIGTTIAGITDATTTKRYVIQLGPGVYTEAPITLKSYIQIQPLAKLGSVRITASDVNNPLITMASLALINGLTLEGVTNDFAVDISAAGFYTIEDIVIFTSGGGVHVNHASATVEVNGIRLDGAALTDGVFIEAGVVSVNGVQPFGTTTATNLVHADGANTILTLSNTITFSPNVVTALRVENSARVVAYNTSLVGCATGVHMGDQVNLSLVGAQIYNTIGDAVFVDGASTASQFTVSGFATEGAGGFNYNVQGAGHVGHGMGISDSSKFNLQLDTIIIGGFVDLQAGDEGFAILGELHVGAPGRGSETCIGEGDSYTIGMQVYTFDGTATYVDVSAAAASPSGSPITLPGLTVNNAFYISSAVPITGDTLQVYGAKISTTTAVVGGSLIIEYWNGGAWVEFHHMSTESGGSYYPYAEDLLQRTGTEQIRFDSTVEDWVKNDPMTLGTSYYWFRIRVTSLLTVAPIIEQVKLHSNRMEINSDGWPEYFASARPIGILPWDIGLAGPGAASPVDQDVYISDNLDVGRTENLFANNATDRIGFTSYLPLDADTSTPFRFRWSVRTDNNDQLNIDWVVRWGWTTDGDNVYANAGDAPATGPNEQSISFSAAAPAINVQATYEVNLDISGMIARRASPEFGDMLWVTLQRTTGDAHAGAVAAINLQGFYLKWCEGGHI